MRARVQKTKIGLGDGASGDLSSLFNTVLMGDLVDLKLGWPKYVRLCAGIAEYRALHQRMVACPLLSRKEMSGAIPSIVAHETAIDTLMAEYCGEDLSDFVDNWDLIEKAQHEAFHAKYDALKKHATLKTLFRSVANIVDYKGDFNDTSRSPQNRLGFVMQQPGMDWAPFPHDFNYGRAMMIEGIGKNTYAWLATYIADFYRIVIQLWKTTQEPDVDVEQFASVINEMADKLQTIPEISRCKGAINVIRSSIGLFKNNFGAYYSSFLDTSDSSSIMHEFIIDVTEANGKNNPELTRQFRTIINFFRKQTELRATTDPQLQRAMQTLNRVIDRTEDATNTKLGAAVRKEAVDNEATTAPKPAARLGKTAASSQPDQYSAARAAAADMTVEELAEFINDGSKTAKKAGGK